MTSTLIKATLNGTLLKRRTGTLATGTRIGAGSLLGPRVFVDSRHGFALAGVSDAQYPAATSDGGRTWRTSGPVLHENAAQAPLAVTQIGALSRSVYWAAGGGEAVDATPDGGRHWYSTLFPGGVLGVLPAGAELLAIVEVPEAHGGPSNAVYESADGGRHWRFDGTR